MSCNRFTATAKQTALNGSSGIPAPHATRPSGYWQDFKNLEREILEFVQNHGTLGIMPRLSEPEAAGCGYLLRPIRIFGGTVDVANRLGLSSVWKRHRPKGASPQEWESNFVAEMADQLACDPALVWEAVRWWKTTTRTNGPLSWYNRKARRRIIDHATQLKRKGQG